MFARFSLAQRLYAAFGALIVLLCVLGGVAYLGVQSIGGTFNSYRDFSQETAAIGQLGQNVAVLHKADLDYRANPSDDTSAAFFAAAKALGLDDTKLMAAFAADPEAQSQLQALQTSVTTWTETFQKSIDLQSQRTDALAKMTEQSAALSTHLTTMAGLTMSLNDISTLQANGQITEAALDAFVNAERYQRTGAQADFDAAMKYAKQTTDQIGDVSILVFDASLKTELDSTLAAMTTYGQLLDGFHTATNSLTDMRTTTLDPAFASIQTAFAGIQTQILDHQTTLGAAGSRQVALVTTISLAIGAFALLVGLALAIGIGRWLSGTIRKMASNMRQLADGNLDLELKADQRHELGQMAQALEIFRTNGQAIRANDAEKAAVMAMETERQSVRDAMQADVETVVGAAVAGDFTKRLTRRYGSADLDAFANSVNNLVSTVDRGISETGAVLSALASADLSQRMNGSYQGAFARLKQDTNAVADKFSNVMGHLRVTSRQIKTATGEILSGANDLSERTTKQAATIEETSAAVEQISVAVGDNARKAEEAASKTHAASEMAQEGGKTMDHANQAMERITASSGKISSIIGLIDDIAFQTNLLALNASVEAARAGDAGKGFAVVAVEVRRLAQSAASASSDVKVLIEQSATEVRSGTRLVADAADKLNAILQAVEENSLLMQTVSNVSREQAANIDAVSISIRQMDEMTQHNAALVEETNAAIEQTEAQASELDNIVDIFTLGQTTPMASVPRAEQTAPKSRGPVQALQQRVKSAAKSFTSRGNAAVDTDWNEF